MIRRLSIQNEVAAISEVSRWIAESGRALGFSHTLTFHVDLAASEAIANTICYGYPDGSRGEIELCLEVVNGQAMLEIEDSGIPFNPLEAHTPPTARSLEEAQIGGLGIRLIRRSMPMCNYEWRNGHNVLILGSPLKGFEETLTLAETETG